MLLFLTESKTRHVTFSFSAFHCKVKSENPSEAGILRMLSILLRNRKEKKSDNKIQLSEENYDFLTTRW